MRLLTAALLTCAVIGLDRNAYASTADVVLYAANAPVVRGNWATTTDGTAAGGRVITSSDLGWSATNAPLASPSNYFEMTFDAPAATTYRVWLRLRASNNSKWNDAVWVQFSDSTSVAGTALYRIGSTSGLLVNLERCSGCGTSGWGWQNTAYWLTQATDIRFTTAGPHTIRVQTREDGVAIDQIVLSPAKYVTTPPGPLTDDTTIVPQPSSPFKGVPFALPGSIAAADFDNGGKGVAYNDTTTGNSGSAYRATDVDVQAASGGGYNIGWTSAGEWLKYSVNVAAAGAYNVQLRVASPSTSHIDVTIGSSTTRFAVANTGGWQAWTNVVMPMTLAAGQQVMTVTFPVGNVNLRSIDVTAQPDVPTEFPTGGTFRMITWNVHHGKNKSNVLNVPSQAGFLATQKPDVIVLQEVQTWDQNQPSMFETELERLTGKNWTRVWAPVTASAGTEGNLVLTHLPVSSWSTFQMHATTNYTAIGPNRSAAQATVSVGGLPVHVFSTHLDYANSTYRTAQLLDLMEWLPRFSGRQIVGGDFNATPGTYWINTMMSEYYDTWQDITGSASGGGTINGVRFDYLFRGKLAADFIHPTSVKVLTTSLSDHYAVMADYTVRP
jgi:endonuclease/exonuclease/phosphatase family metal-dependent hydrolase